jgi:hypothetical protein
MPSLSRFIICFAFVSAFGYGILVVLANWPQPVQRQIVISIPQERPAGVSLDRWRVRSRIDSPASSRSSSSSTNPGPSHERPPLGTGSAP